MYRLRIIVECLTLAISNCIYLVKLFEPSLYMKIGFWLIIPKTHRNLQQPSAIHRNATIETTCNIDPP